MSGADADGDQIHARNRKCTSFDFSNSFFFQIKTIGRNEN